MNRRTHNFLHLLAASMLPVGLIGCSAQVAYGGAQPEVAADYSPIESPSEFDESRIVPDGTRSTDGQVVKDVKKQTLPVDPYLPSNSTMYNKAREVFISKCLKDYGFNEELPTMSVGELKPKDPAIAPNTGKLIFTPENAGKYGYYYASIIPDDESSDFETALAKLSDSMSGEQYADEQEGTILRGMPSHSDVMPMQWAKEVASCEENFHERFPEPNMFHMADDSESSSYEEELKYEPLNALFYYTGENTPVVKAAKDRWRKCMAPLGIADLPQSPEEMPPASSTDAWFSNMDESPLMVSKPKKEELDLAKKDAECRESSGYTQISYDVAWGMLQDYVNTNQKDLEEVRNKHQQTEQEYINYIKMNQ